MFKNTKVTTLVMMVLGAMAVTVAALGIYNSRELRHADDSDQILYEQNAVPLAEVGAFSRYFYRAWNNTLQAGLIADPALRAPVLAKAEDRLRQADERLEATDKAIKIEAVREAFAGVKRAYEPFRQDMKGLFAALRSGDSANVLKGMTNGAVEAQRVALGEATDKFVTLLTDRAKARSEGNTAEANAAVRNSTVLVGLAALFAFATGLLLYRRMSGLFGQLNNETERLATAAVEGKLQTRADTSDAYLECRPIMEGFNKILDAVIGPLNVTAKYVDSISKGDIPEKITDTYNGDFNTIKTNLNACIDQLSSLIRDMNRMSTEHDRGDIDVTIPADKFHGAYQTMATGVNTMVMGHIAVKKKAMACIAEFGKGNFEATLEKFPGKKVFINDTIELLRTNLKTFIAEMTRMSTEHDRGDIDVTIPVDKFQGSYQTMATGVNTMVMGHIAVKKKAMACLTEFGKGNFEATLEKFPGKKAFINDTFEQVRTNLKALIADANMLSRAAVEGKLATRADASKHQGDFRKIVQGVNDTLDAVIGPLNVSAKYVDQISKGDIPAKITDTYNGDFNTIKNNLNQCIDAVNALVADAAMLAKAAVEGKLATRADASKHFGDYRKIVQGVNDTLDSVIGPLNVSARYVDQISKGNIPAKITDTYNGDFNTIKNNLNQCIDAVNALVADAAMLAKAAVDGKLATRADASKHFGDYRKVVQGVNDTLDSVIGPLNVSARYVDQISKGDIPAKITDTYNGDFNTIKNNLNQCIDAVNALVADAGMLAKAAVEGKLATRADASKHFGDYRKIVQGVNETLDAVIGPLNVSARYVDQISKGEIPAKITDTYNGDFNTIKNNLNQCIDAVNVLVADAVMLSKAAVDGKLATRADASKHKGDYRKVVQGVNETLDAVIGPLNVTAKYVDSISKGEIPAKITDNYNGDFNLIKNNLNQCIEAVNMLVGDALMLAQAAVEGKLTTRADATQTLGRFQEDRPRRQPNPRCRARTHQRSGRGARKAVPARSPCSREGQLPGGPRQDQGIGQCHGRGFARCALAGRGRGGSGVVRVRADRLVQPERGRRCLATGQCAGRNLVQPGVHERHDQAVGRQRPTGQRPGPDSQGRGHRGFGGHGANGHGHDQDPGVRRRDVPDHQGHQRNRLPNQLARLERGGRGGAGRRGGPRIRRGRGRGAQPGPAVQGSGHEDRGADQGVRATSRRGRGHGQGRFHQAGGNRHGRHQGHRHRGRNLGLGERAVGRHRPGQPRGHRNEQGHAAERGQFRGIVLGRRRAVEPIRRAGRHDWRVPAWPARPATPAITWPPPRWTRDCRPLRALPSAATAKTETMAATASRSSPRT